MGVNVLWSTFNSNPSIVVASICPEISWSNDPLKLTIYASAAFLGILSRTVAKYIESAIQHAALGPKRKVDTFSTSEGALSHAITR